MTKLRVMLVDDHPVVRKGLRALLEGEPDMEVVGEAGDGTQAVELAQTLKPDIITMDISMPEMDGLEATRRIRRLDAYRDTPIIALTADAFESERQRYLDAGMSDHLAKPLQAARLYTALAQWLATAPGRRA